MISELTLVIFFSVQLADAVTTDLFAQNALITAVACALFKLDSTGYGSLKMLAVGNAVALLLKMDDAGFSTDTIMANKVMTVVTIILAVLAFA